MFFIIISILLVYNIDFIRNKTGRWISLYAASSSTQNSPINNRKHAQLSQQEIATFKDGDIILRRGFGGISNLIYQYFSENSGVTHCGILNKKNQEWHVINCESNGEHEGMQLTPLNRFLKESHPNSIIVVRLNENEETVALFLNSANTYLEKQIAFDYKFDNNDSSEFYCTELIELSLKQALGKNILTKHKNFGHIEIPTYNNFIESTYFQVKLSQLDY